MPTRNQHFFPRTHRGRYLINRATRCRFSGYFRSQGHIFGTRDSPFCIRKTGVCAARDLHFNEFSVSALTTEAENRRCENKCRSAKGPRSVDAIVSLVTPTSFWPKASAFKHPLECTEKALCPLRYRFALFRMCFNVCFRSNCTVGVRLFFGNLLVF